MNLVSGVKWCMVPRHQAIVALILVAVGSIFSLWGLARGMGWGVAQVGPLSSYLAALATITAVSVALRQSAQARKLADESLLAAKARAEIDRDFTHRRETTKQIIEMWTILSQIEPALLAFGAKFHKSAPAEDAFDKLHTATLSGATAIFAAQTISLNSHLVAALDDVALKLKDFKTILRRPKVGMTNRSAYMDELAESWLQITALQVGFTQLLQTHLPLLEGAETEKERINELDGLRQVREVVAEAFARMDPQVNTFNVLARLVAEFAGKESDNAGIEVVYGVGTHTSAPERTANSEEQGGDKAEDKAERSGEDDANADGDGEK